MLKPYDEETDVRYEVEMCDVMDVAENGEEGKIETIHFRNLPPDDLLEKYARKKGYDTIQITTVTEKTIRYTVE